MRALSAVNPRPQDDLRSLHAPLAVHLLNLLSRQRHGPPKRQTRFEMPPFSMYTGPTVSRQLVAWSSVCLEAICHADLAPPSIHLAWSCHVMSEGLSQTRVEESTASFPKRAGSVAFRTGRFEPVRSDGCHLKPPPWRFAGLIVVLRSAHPKCPVPVIRRPRRLGPDHIWIRLVRTAKAMDTAFRGRSIA